MDDELLCLGVLEGILSGCCHKLFLKHIGWSSIDRGFLKCTVAMILAVMNAVLAIA